ncbi:hypothetical protein PJ900_21920 [Tistrella mobilis]|uniref:Uncharacterized protein n=1 Tax=Tistrella mobilis TaxID=171437 RepID=A0A162L492_9PROT|nr:hypothetical protein [Tistrella mobilis]KYO53193.1 hypothetical protein AUP44_27015 [Tistrella mobilis]
MTITAFDLASLAYTAARLAIERTGRSRGTVAARHRLIRKARRAMVAADSLIRQLDDGSGPAADMPPRDPETGLPVWYVQLWVPAGPVDADMPPPLDWATNPTEAVVFRRMTLFDGYICPRWRYRIFSPLDHPGMIAIDYDTPWWVQNAGAWVDWWRASPFVDTPPDPPEFPFPDPWAPRPDPRRRPGRPRRRKPGTET